MTGRVLVVAARAFNGASMVDGPITLIAREERIEELTTGPVSPEPGDKILAFEDCTLLPGLIDSHVHLARDGEPDYMAIMLRETSAFQALKAFRNAQTDLAAGFTTLRTAGDRGRVDIAVKKAGEAGIVRVPRIHAAGKVLCVTGGHRDGYFSPEVTYEGNATIVNGDAEVRRAIREEAKAGADWIKIVVTGGVVSPTDPLGQQMSSEEIEAAVREARRLGRKTSAHAHGGGGVLAAVNAGVDSIEHGTYADERALAAMAERGTFLTPTLTAISNLVLRGPQEHLADVVLEKARRAWNTAGETFRKAYESGVRIVCGTDAGGTCCRHGQAAAELRAMVQLGMPPLAALQSATAVPARLLGVETRVGRLAPGYLCDLLLVEGNPLDSMDALERVRCVLLGGTVVKSTPRSIRQGSAPPHQQPSSVGAPIP